MLERSGAAERGKMAGRGRGRGREGGRGGDVLKIISMSHTESMHLPTKVRDGLARGLSRHCHDGGAASINRESGGVSADRSLCLCITT